MSVQSCICLFMYQLRQRRFGFVRFGLFQSVGQYISKGIRDNAEYNGNIDVNNRMLFQKYR